MSVAKKIALQDGESIELTVNQHWIRVATHYFVAAVILGLVSFFSSWLWHHDRWGLALFWVGLGLGLGLFIKAWLVHKSNVMIITSERVVRVRRLGLFDELITSLYFDELFDTTVRRSGMSSRLFKYGTIVLRGQSGDRALDMRFVPAVQDIERIILDQRDLKRSTNTPEVSQKALYGLFLSRLPDFTDLELEAALEAVEREIHERTEASPRG
jgi:hypothetical protein